MSINIKRVKLSHFLHNRTTRKGFVLLIVLLVIIGGMALTYSALHVIGVQQRIVRNLEVHERARAAAQSGLSIAFSKMFSADWPGVGTTLAGSCGPNEAFEVSYVPGDVGISQDHDESSRYPYRVTLKAKGMAWLPGEAEYPGIYDTSWVVELVPRALAPEPSDWDTIQKYTFYQTVSNSNQFNIPYQVSGSVCFQGQVRIASDYPSATARQQYMADLYAMKEDGYPDYRPFTGIVTWPQFLQTYDDIAALTVWLNVQTLSLLPRVVGPDLQIPSNLNQYQLFPGGPIYSVPQLPERLSDVLLAPDPATNPCGLFFRAGNLTVENNVSWQGTVIVTGDVTVRGDNLFAQAVPLVSPVADKNAVQLPVLVCKNLRFESATGHRIQGMVRITGELQIKKSPDTTSIEIVGKMFAGRFRIDPRTPWDTLDWDKKLSEFLRQKPTATGDNRYFPLWLRQFGLDPAPKLIFQAGDSQVAYHWKDATNTIYVPAPQDITALDVRPALRWAIVRVVEN